MLVGCDEGSEFNSLRVSGFKNKCYESEDTAMRVEILDMIVKILL